MDRAAVVNRAPLLSRRALAGIAAVVALFGGVGAVVGGGVLAARQGRHPAAPDACAILSEDTVVTLLGGPAVVARRAAWPQRDIGWYPLPAGAGCTWEHAQGEPRELIVGVRSYAGGTLGVGQAGAHRAQAAYETAVAGSDCRPLPGHGSACVAHLPSEWALHMRVDNLTVRVWLGSADAARTDPREVAAEVESRLEDL